MGLLSNSAPLVSPRKWILCGKKTLTFIWGDTEMNSFKWWAAWNSPEQLISGFTSFIWRIKQPWTADHWVYFIYLKTSRLSQTHMTSVSGPQTVRQSVMELCLSHTDSLLITQPVQNNRINVLKKNIQSPHRMVVMEQKFSVKILHSAVLLAATF